MYKFIAHRGNDMNKPENSSKAILNALSKAYIDGVEFDIRITKDNKFVINHNASINLNSKKTGFIKNMTLKELKSIDFYSNNQKYKIATLNEVLKKINNYKIIMIEIKEEKNYNRYQKKKLLKIINKYKNLNIYLMSFNYKLISDLSKYFHNSGLLIGKVLNRNKNISNFSFIATPLDFYKKYKENKKIFIWTINSIKDLNEIKENSYIITDEALKLFNYSHNLH